MTLFLYTPSQKYSVEDISLTFFSKLTISVKRFAILLSLGHLKLVTQFDYMFESADSFTGNISSWGVRNVTDMTGMFHNLILATANYDALLISWSKQAIQSNVDFDAGSSQYSMAAQAARDILIVDYGWDITDAGLAP